jgi:HD-GYP domain-containing protein (c-di-GMP phosphodiesterase class II)
MTTDRPYRGARPVEAAVAEMRANAGSQFDPRVVEALIEVVAEWGATEPVQDGAHGDQIRSQRPSLVGLTRLRVTGWAVKDSNLQP